MDRKTPLRVASVLPSATEILCFIGGEQFLVDDESTSLMQKIDHIAMEIHFKGTHPRCPFLIEWSFYNDWVNNSFRDTHAIQYHRSSKKKGLGVFVLRNKLF